MLPRNYLLVLFAALQSISLAGCREAARSPDTQQLQIGSSAAIRPNDARPIPQNAVHARPLRRDASHETLSSIYNNPEDGISFRYPRNYSLEEGDVQERSFFLLRQGDLDNEQPGARLLATILIPEDGYPNTTFEHGSLQLAINQAETESACLQMCEVEAKSRSIAAQGLVLHWSEHESEVAGTRILQRKYAGHSQGTCYEFVLTVAAEESLDPDGFTKPADLARIMKQLGNIVTGSKILAKSTPPTAELSK